MLTTDEGILFTCDDDGRISQVHFNGLDIPDEELKSKLFPELFQDELINKALEFLVKIKQESASFGWELFFKPEISKEPFYFSGALIEGDLFILGSRTKVDFNQFIIKMMILNNEQINRIRALEKAQQENFSQSKNDSNNLFDELSSLNNELVSMQRALTKKNTELARLNDIKNQFLGMAAHDLRNPLSNILNFAEFLESEKDSFTTDQAEFICHIKNQSSFMLKLVNDLLDISAIESGNVNLTLEPIDIVLLVKQTINLNKALADKKKIKVELNSSLETSTLLLDKSKIEQVVTNLLTNALKYSNAETTIKIEIKKEMENILILVHDEGQGIPKDELDNLFQPFQKTSVESTGGEKSVGLGLFIVKKIVEAHNGNIWAESEVGKGTTFYISLPNKS